MRYLSTLILLLAFNQLSAQERLFYVNLEGNWDYSGDESRARFAGNNQLIKAHFSKFASDIFRAGQPNGKVVNSISSSMNQGRLTPSLCEVAWDRHMTMFSRISYPKLAACGFQVKKVMKEYPTK